jgi:hypothetical protein
VLVPCRYPRCCALGRRVWPKGALRACSRSLVASLCAAPGSCSWEVGNRFCRGTGQRSGHVNGSGGKGVGSDMIGLGWTGWLFELVGVECYSTPEV